jgi:hypothetical protein
VAFIERSEFQSLIDGSPALWFTVLRQLSQDVNESYSIIRGRRAENAVVRIIALWCRGRSDR